MMKCFTWFNAKGFGKAVASLLLILLFVQYSNNVNSQAAVNCWAGWASNGSGTAGTFTPPCAPSTGTLAAPSTGYTYWSGTPSASYTFTASAGTGWATPYISVYYLNAACNAWVGMGGGASTVTFSTPASGQCNQAAPYLVTVISGGSSGGCTTAWPGGGNPSPGAAYSSTLTYKQNAITVTPTSTNVCANGSTTTLTLSPTGGTTSMNSGSGSVSGATYTAPNTGVATTGVVKYVLGQCTATSATINNNALSNAGSLVTSPLYLCTSSNTSGGVIYNSSGVATTPSITGYTGAIVDWYYGQNGNRANNWGNAGNANATGNCCFGYLSSCAVNSVDVQVVNGGCPAAWLDYTFLQKTASITSVTPATTPICGGSTTTFTANGVNGIQTSVAWWTGTGGTGNSLGSGTTYTGGADQTFYARVTDVCGNVAEASGSAALTAATPTVTAPAAISTYNSPNNSCQAAEVFATPAASDGTCPGEPVGTIDIFQSPVMSSVASNLKLWVKGDAGVVLDGTGKVAEWRDLSGNGNHFKQATFANRPAKTASSTSFNSNPVITFSSTSQYLTDVNSLDAGAASTYTMFVVDRLNGGTNSRLVSSASTNWLFGNWGTYQDEFHFNCWISNPSTAPDALAHMYEATSSGTTASGTIVYDAGVSLATGTACSPNGPGQLQLNGYNCNASCSEFSTGEVAEIIYFNTVLSTAQRQYVEGYLAYKYNVQAPIASMQAFQTYSTGGLTNNTGTATTETFITADQAANLSSTVTSTATAIAYPGPTLASSATEVCAGTNVTLTTSGMAPAGQSLTTPAINDYMLVGTSGSASNVVIGSNWTIETWVNFSNLSTVQGYGVNTQWNTLIRGTAYHHMIIARYSASQLYLGTYVGGFYSSGYNLSGVTGWHHVTAVGSGGYTSYYVDGVKVGVAAAQATDAIVAIGNVQSGGQPTGQMDEVRIWNAALPQNTISKYMTQALTSAHPYVATNNLVGYYKMDGNGTNSASAVGSTGACSTCTGTTQGTAAVTTASAFYTYNWSGPGSPTFSPSAASTAESVTISAPTNAQSGTYNCYTTAGPSSCSSQTTTKAVQVDLQPVITAPAGVCTNSTAAVSSNTSVTWSVSSGSLNVTSGTATTFTPAAITAPTQNQTVTITAVNGLCTTTKTIRVDNLNSISAPTANPSPVCDNSTLAITGNIAGVVWTMSPTIGTIATTPGQNVTFTPTALTGTTQNATTTITATNGVCTAPTLNVRVDHNLSTVSVPAAVCTNSTASITSSVAGISWASSSGSVAPAAGQNTTFTPAAITAPTQNQTVTITVTNGSCSVSPTIRVDNLNSISAPTANPSPVCDNATMAITGNIAGVVWTMSPTIGTIATTPGQNVTFTPTALTGTTQNATTTISATNGACAAATLNVRVDHNVASISVPAAICTNGTAAITNGVAGVTWSTSAGSVSPTTGQNTTLTPAAITAPTQNQTVTITATNGACSATGTIRVDNKNSISAPTANPSPVCDNTTLAITGNISGVVWTQSPSIGSIATTPGQNVTFTPTALTGTTQNATTTISATNGSCAAATLNVRVDHNVASVSIPAAVCTNSTAAITSGVAGITWATSAGSVSPTSGQNTTLTPAAITAPTQNQTVTITATNGACSATGNIRVDNLNSISAPTANPSPVCDNATLAITGTISGVVWTQSPSIGSIATTPGQSVTFTPTALTGTTQNATTTITATNGVCTPQTLNVRVDHNTASVSGPVAICTNGTAAITSSVAGVSWTTSAGTMAPTSGQNSTLTPAAITAPTQNQTVTVTAANGACSATTTVRVDRLNAITSPSANPSPVCDNATLAIAGTTSGVVWTMAPSIGSIATTPGQNVTFTPTALTGTTQNATTTITATNGVCTAQTLNVRVDHNTSSVSAPAAICTNGTAAVTNSVSGVTWSTSAGSVSPTTGQNTTLTPAAITAPTQNQNVTVTAANGSCSATAIVRVDNKNSITTAPATVCNSTTAAYAGNISGVVWTSSAGAMSGAAQNATFTPQSISAPTANQNVTVTATNGVCTAPTAVIRVDNQNAITSPPSAVCDASGTVALTGTISGVVWSTAMSANVTGTSINSPGQNATLTPGSVSGTNASANITVTATNGSCTATKNIQVDHGPSPSVTSASQAQCNNGNFSLTATQPPYGSGLWTCSANCTGVTINTPGSYSAASATGVPVSTTTTVLWTVTNGTCSANASETLRNDNQAGISGTTTPCVSDGTDAYNSSGAGTSPTPVWSVTPSSAGSITSSGVFSPNAISGATLNIPVTINLANGTCTTNFNATLWNQAYITPQSNVCETTPAFVLSATVNGNTVYGSPSSGLTFSGSAVTWNGGTSRYMFTPPAQAGISSNYVVTLHAGTSNCGDIAVITVYKNPNAASAGSNQSQCNTSTFTLAGNNPTAGGGYGTGTWTIVSGPGSITTPNAYNSTVTGVTAGSSTVLQWTVVNGVCSSSSQVTLTNNAVVTTSNAGTNLEQCNTSTFTLSGNNPSVGTGTWSILSGPGTVTSPTSNVSTVTGVTAGSVTTVQWTISNGTCSSSSSVTLTNDANASTSSAGSNQEQCNTSTFTLAGSIPTVGTGLWSIVSGPGSITTATQNNSTLTGVTAGSVTVAKWTITNGLCSTSSQVSLTNDATPTTANAGADFSSCGLTATLAGNSPSVGTGLWTQTAGTGTTTFNPATSNTSPTTVTLTGTYTYLWTITNGLCTSGASVHVTYNPFPTDITPTVAVAGNPLCSGSATNIQLAGSVSGINYELQNVTGPTNVYGPVAGTGGAINFPTGNLSATTTFDVKATDATTGCIHTMTVTPTVIITTPDFAIGTLVPSGHISFGAVNNTTLPSGWTATANTPSNSNSLAWTLSSLNRASSANYHYYNAIGGTSSASTGAYITTPSGASSPTVDLITPNINTTGYTNINVYWGAQKSSGYTGTVAFSYSADGGSTWNAVSFIDVQSNVTGTPWNLVNNSVQIKLPAGANNISTLKLKWTANPSSTDYYSINDISVYGLATITLCSPANLSVPYMSPSCGVDHYTIAGNSWPTFSTITNATLPAQLNNITYPTTYATAGTYNLDLTMIASGTGLSSGTINFPVKYDPIITTTVNLENCGCINATNYQSVVSVYATGGGSGGNFTFAPMTGSDLLKTTYTGAGIEQSGSASGVKGVFWSKADGNVHQYNVSDAQCTVTLTRYTQNGAPLDIAFAASSQIPAGLPGAGGGNNISASYNNAGANSPGISSNKVNGPALTCHQTADFGNNWVTYVANNMNAATGQPNTNDTTNNKALVEINNYGQDLDSVAVSVYREPLLPSVPNVTGVAGACYQYPEYAMERHFVIQSSKSTGANSFASNVGVRLYFSDAELQDLIYWTNYGATVNSGGVNAGCASAQIVNNTGQIYVTKYTGNYEDGDYTNNSPSGLYRMFGPGTTLSGNGPSTFDGGGATPGYSQNAHHFVEFNVREFSEFWLHGSGDIEPLPVEMIYFEAEAINNEYIELSWATDIEINNKEFQVERSVDGQSWSHIGTVEGHGNSTSKLTYTFDDVNVVPNLRYYYRLKQVDFNQNFKYTGVVSAILSGSGAFSMSLSPNPTYGNTNLIINTTKNQPITVDVYDVIGQKMVSGNNQLSAGYNRIELDLGHLAAGTYTVSVISANQMYTRKLVIAK